MLLARRSPLLFQHYVLKVVRMLLALPIPSRSLRLLLQAAAC